MLSNIVRTTGHRPITTSKGLSVTAVKRIRSAFICRNKIGDELLDFVTAGPKLRKWYGAGERPVDGGEEQEPEEPDAASDVVLVTEADSPIGEQVVLQLILARQQLRLLVRDVAAAKTAYGPYTTPLPAEAVNSSPARALRGVKCLVLLGRPARGLLEAAKAAKVGHVVLLSAAPAAASDAGGLSLGPFSLLGSGRAAARELRDLADSTAEASVKASGLPYSVVQVYGFQDPGSTSGDGGGSGGVSLLQQQLKGSGGGGGGGSRRAVIRREDLAALISGLVDAVPERGRTLQAVPSTEATALGGSPPFSPQRRQEALEAALQDLQEDASP